MPGIWDYLMTPPDILEGRKQEEQERKRLEALAKLYQFNEAETAELLQTGNVAQVRAEKERRIKQKEAERVQKFQKAEEAGRALTQKHLLKDMSESVRGKLSREAQVGRGEVSVPQMTEFEQKGTLGQVLLPGEEVAKVKQRRLLETEAKKRQLPLDKRVSWTTAIQQARLILTMQARDREKQVQEIRNNIMRTEYRMPRPDELPPPTDFSDANIRKVAKEIQQQGELPAGVTETPKIPETPKKIKPPKEFLDYVADRKKKGVEINWAVIALEHPDWDLTGLR